MELELHRDRIMSSGSGAVHSKLQGLLALVVPRCLHVQPWIRLPTAGQLCAVIMNHVVLSRTYSEMNIYILCKCTAGLQPNCCCTRARLHAQSLQLFTITDAGLLKELVGSHDSRQLAELAESALQLLPDLPSLDRSDREQRTQGDQLHSSAIALWNRFCENTSLSQCVPFHLLNSNQPN